MMMSLPQWIRGLIPLAYWPQWCHDQQGLYDVIIDMMEEHNKSWQAGDEITTLFSQV